MINPRLLQTTFTAALVCTALNVQAADRTVIQNKGSDTLVNVAQAWAEAYREVDPNVAVAVSGGGSGTGIAAMINGTVDIANASRQMKDKEIKRLRKAVRTLRRTWSATMPWRSSFTRTIRRPP